MLKFARMVNRRYQMPHYLKGIIFFSKRCFYRSTFICASLVCCAYVLYPQYCNQNGSKSYADEILFSVRKPRCAVNYTGVKNYTTELIYILMWSKRFYIPWQEEGQGSFIQNECSYTNCYFTLNKSLFGDDITKFDAIIFESSYRFPKRYKVTIPQVRSPRQKYIYYSMESARRFPNCDERYDSLFNWTMTYRLDSDIVYSYFYIKNNNGEVVGPKRNMEWVADVENIDKDLEKRLRAKTKAAAWFVSYCNAASNRDEFVRNLQKHLNKYNLTVDVYGTCGPLKCPRTQSNVCDAMIEKDYYFYMALENTFEEDYVTEKVLRALQNDAVPIVYGGANYSRFLPPGSYIDGRAYSASGLADIMYGLTLSQTAYSQYFRWKKYYTYHDSTNRNICNLCEALNDREKFQTFSLHKDFRHWWNGHFKRICRITNMLST